MCSSSNFSLIIFITFSFIFNGILGFWLLVIINTRGQILICEDIPVNLCAFAVASSGKRCLLENFENKDGNLDYHCRSSNVVVPMMMADHIETDSCIAACGVDRKSVGISSDSLMEPRFTTKLCSPACYTGCPNILQLYFDLASDEGVFLPDLCMKQITNPHRAMIELGAVKRSAPANLST